MVYFIYSLDDKTSRGLFLSQLLAAQLTALLVATPIVNSNPQDELLRHLPDILKEITLVSKTMFGVRPKTRRYPLGAKTFKHMNTEAPKHMPQRSQVRGNLPRYLLAPRRN